MHPEPTRINWLLFIPAILIIAIGCFALAAHAQCPKCNQWHPPFHQYGPAHRKAEDAARLCMKGHRIPGHPLVVEGADYEGCGQSSFGPWRAITIACYWGELKPIDIGYAKGRDGYWYAVVGYSSERINSTSGQVDMPLLPGESRQ